MPLIKLAGTDLSWACEDGDTILRSAIRAGLGSWDCPNAVTRSGITGSDVSVASRGPTISTPR